MQTTLPKPGPSGQTIIIRLVKSRYRIFLRHCWGNQSGLRHTFNICIKTRPDEGPGRGSLHAVCRQPTYHIFTSPLPIGTRHTSSCNILRIKLQGTSGRTASKSQRRGYWTSFAGCLSISAQFFPQKRQVLIASMTGPSTALVCLHSYTRAPTYGAGVQRGAR